MNNDSFLIEESDIALAQSICNDIENDENRNFAMSNALAAKISKHFFTEVEVDTETGLHNITSIIEKKDISDIYINNSYIDVRLYVNNTLPKIPKEHFELGLLPCAYMFIKIEEDLSSANVIGFIAPENIDQDSLEDGFYTVNEEDMVSYYDIEGLLSNVNENDIPDDFDLKIFNFLDEIDDSESFYKSLLSSSFLRKATQDAYTAQKYLEDININPELVDNEIEDSSTEENIEHIEVANTEEDDDAENFELNTEDEEPDTVLSEDLGMGSIEDNDLIDIEEYSDELEEVTPLDEFETSESFEEPVDILDETTDDFIDLAESTDDIISIETEQEDSLIENDSLENFVLEENDTNLDIVAEEDTQSLDFNSFSTNTTPSIETIEKTEDYNDEELIETENSSDSENNFEIYNNEPDENIEVLSIVDTPLDEDETNLEVQEQDEEVALEKELVEDTDEIELESSEEYFEENIEEDVTEDVEDEEDIETVEDAENPVLDNLFDHSENSNETLEEDDYENYMPEKQNKSKILPIIGVLAVVGALGYFGYTKFFNTQITTEKTNNKKVEAVNTKNTPKKVNTQKNTAPMPLETIENVKTQKQTNEGNAISIPAIEQNLGASINVANLTVNWEVPSTYISNVTAKKYFTKIGKIIQLNLKTELLLLSKPPITNKIALELEFDKSSNGFKVKNMATSSGEKVVDDLITKTVQSCLNINLKTNMSIFENISGNPTLIIRL